ncbi:glycoside hydrolase family 3 N-terminal domain-containing protein [Treponema pectinovorum]|uniref:glycoside hydrolase family 3 N-terminal domain-containing protein n=1 Tax=Treponema pectinovorum TaxID=164 RepID=UPI0011F0A9C1|nr:glycoside hydrolase family 3 N-terminal domain-containing protein [Treponema pectinovorum]
MKRFYFFSIFFIFALFSFLACKNDEKSSSKISEAKDEAIKDFVRNLQSEVKISQLFLVNIEGNQKFIPVETCKIFSEQKKQTPLLAGGCLFFGYNIAKSKGEVQTFIKSIHDFYLKNQNPPPFIAVDQEGGDVNRLKSLTNIFPSNKTVASKMTLEQAEKLYKEQADELCNLGFNMNLAPVVEVETPENLKFLGTRSFGSLQKVLEYAPLEINAFENQKVLTVLKHFPGNTNTDPHTGLPEIKLDLKTLNETYLLPFKELLPFSSAVLMSHARLCLVQSDIEENASDFDKDLFLHSKTFKGEPACLSNFWVGDVLRKHFSFAGLVISDDIFMGALALNGFPPDEAAIKAIESGTDIIMLSEKRYGEVAKLLLQKAASSSDFALKIDRAVERVIEYKIKAGLLEFEEVEDSLKQKQKSNPIFKVKIAQKFLDSISEDLD